MKKMVTMLVSFLILIFIFLSFRVEAKDSFHISFRTSLNSMDQILQPGDQVVVTFSFDHFQERGIYAYQATFSYDRDIFEEVTEKNFVSMNDWNAIQYNKRNGGFISFKSGGIKVAEDVFYITLRVKNSVSVPNGFTQIKISNVVATDGISEIHANDQTLSFSILPTSSVVSTSNLSSIKPTLLTNFVFDNHKIEDNASYFPSFFSYYLLIIVTVFIFILLILLYRKRDAHRSIYRMLVFTFMSGALFLQFFGITCEVVVAFAGRGELTGNDIIDYSDVLLLESHLIQLTPLPHTGIKNADMNVDGHVTITDLALLVQKLERSLDYEVVLSSIQTSKVYTLKNEENILTFQASINYPSVIKKVIINDQEYDAIIEQDHYKVEFSTSSKAGKNSYYITNVLLDNGRKIDVHYSFTVDNLKDRPVIEDFVQKENNMFARSYFDFYIVDFDQAFVNGRMVLIDSIDGSIQESPIHVGKNRLDFSIKEGRNYNYQILITYDLDSNSDDYSHFVMDDVVLSDSFFATSNYQIKVLNAQLQKNTVSKGEKIGVSFMCDSPLSRVIINDHEYALVKHGNVYYAFLDGFHQEGEVDLFIQGVVIEENKIVSFEDIPLKVQILKDKPSIADFHLKEDVSKLKVAMDISVIDSDSSFLNGKVVLKKEDGGTLEKEIHVGNNHITFHLENAVNYSYSLQITYDRDSSVFHFDYLVINEVLKTGNLFLMNDYKLTVSNITANKEYGVSSYFSRGDEAFIQFQSSNISSFVPVKAVINGKKYELIEKGDFYQARVSVPLKAGIKNFVIEKLILSNGKKITIPKKMRNKVRLEVLKDDPILLGFKRKDSFDSLKSTFHFSILDLDQAFVRGKIILKGDDGTLEEKKIKVGKNNITFSLKENVLYNYCILITYDEDSNKVDNINLVTDKIYKKGEMILKMQS